jgi:hypothetical protein
MENVSSGEGLWSEIELAAQTQVQKMLATFSCQIIFISSTSQGHWQTLKDKFAGIIQQFQNVLSSRFLDFHKKRNGCNYNIRTP